MNDFFANNPAYIPKITAKTYGMSACRCCNPKVRTSNTSTLTCCASTKPALDANVAFNSR
jgi:hypothetical protein